MYRCNDVTEASRPFGAPQVGPGFGAESLARPRNLDLLQARSPFSETFLLGTHLTGTTPIIVWGARSEAAPGSEAPLVLTIVYI